jgi:hypothetical protein
MSVLCPASCTGGGPQSAARAQNEAVAGLARPAEGRALSPRCVRGEPWRCDGRYGRSEDRFWKRGLSIIPGVAG